MCVQKCQRSLFSISKYPSKNQNTDVQFAPLSPHSLFSFNSFSDYLLSREVLLKLGSASPTSGIRDPSGVARLCLLSGHEVLKNVFVHVKEKKYTQYDNQKSV